MISVCCLHAAYKQPTQLNCIAISTVDSHQKFVQTISDKVTRLRAGRPRKYGSILSTAKIFFFTQASDRSAGYPALHSVGTIGVSS